MMPKRERKMQVLRFLNEHKLALQPSNIFFNLKRQGATFGKKSVDRYLREMTDDGLVNKVEGTDGYYEITDKGRKFLEQQES